MPFLHSLDPCNLTVPTGWLRQVFGLAMSQTGLRSLMIRQDQLNDITGQPRVEFEAFGSKVIMVSIVTGE